MPRQSFVLLVLVLLVGFWTPPQETRAQTGCPEDGCKTYLPVIHTPMYATAKSYSVGQTKRYCDEQWTGVALTNVVDVPLTGIVVKGYYTSGYPELFPDSSYSYTTTDVLFPGETFKYPVELDSCSGSGGYGDTKLYGAVPISGVAPLDVVTKDVSWGCGAFGQRGYGVTLELRNAGRTTLTGIKAFLAIYIASQLVQVDVSQLAPGESTTIHQSLTYVDDPIDLCGSAPSKDLSAHAWGTIALPR